MKFGQLMRKAGLKIIHPIDYNWNTDHLHKWEVVSREFTDHGSFSDTTYKEACNCGEKRERFNIHDYFGDLNSNLY